MWNIDSIAFESLGATKYYVTSNNNKLSFEAIIDLLIHSTEFRLFFNEILANNKFVAYFFEVKSVTNKQIDKAFEFVLVSNETLSNIKADKTAFNKQLTNNQPIVSFFNLNKDAILIVPNEISQQKYYAHLAIFVRNADKNQIDQFWKTVGIKYKESISEKPIWLSTSGLGVYWLHMRIDQRPKYYSFNEYKDEI